MRRSFTPEFRAEAVRRVREGSKSLPHVAGDLGLTGSALRNQVQAFLLASCLVASMSAAGEESRRVRVTLSAEVNSRAEALGPHLEDWKEGVLSLRVVDPGRLVVKAGAEVIAAGSLGWGEDQRLRVDPLEAFSPEVLPRVVNRERGREEVEVEVPEGVGAGEQLTLIYEWDWKHAGKPALERTWRLPPREDIPPEWLEEEPSEPEWEDTLEDEADAQAFLSPELTPFPVQVDPARPELFWVAGYASREDIASRLFGDAVAAGAFDFEPHVPPPGTLEGLQVCVRVRRPTALVPELLATMRRALEAQLEADVAWSRSQLSAASLDRAGAAALVERGLRWAQRSDIPDEAGQSYFDRYLQALGPLRDEDWHRFGEAAEPLRKAIALRSKHFEANYGVTDGSPVLTPGSVVGRFYFADGSSVQVRTLLLLTEETSLERAELRVRNAPRGSPRVIIPGEDGRWRGYSAEFNTVAGAREPLEHPEGKAYWYYPGTLLIRPGDWRPGLGGGTGELATLRRELLQTALATATPQAPQPLVALDYDVLSLLTPEERLGVFNTVLEGSALTSDVREDAVHLLGRVLLSTPDREFPPLERKLTSSGALEKLLGGNALDYKVLLGQAFTQKALASFPLTLDLLESLPTFHLGREGETTHLLNVPSGWVSTVLVAPEAWEAQQGVHLGAEPALPGEAVGPSRRMALYFQQVQQRFEARYFPSVDELPRSRALHPLDWVRVKVHGPQPRTHLMTAMELALLASSPDTSLFWSAVGRISEMHLVYGAVSALARAPLLTGGAATAAQGSTLAGARGAAVGHFVGRMSLVTSLAVVDTYRDELSQTAEGRDFLAVHDLALVALAGRDIYKLATSGIGRELIHRGGLALSAAGARASSGLRESVESLQALVKTLERMLAEGKAVATPDGLRFSLPGGAEAFRQAFFAIRGEMAAARALGGIRGAGLAVEEAEKTLEALKLLAAESQEMALAYNAVARRAAGLPADRAQAYLAAVESLRTTARSNVRPALAELLRRSGAPSLKDPLAFLKEAEWLVSHSELEAEAVVELARKAHRGSVDLGWLRSTGLNLEYLNFMGRNEKTAWKLLQQAAAEPWNLAVQRRAREQLRGIAVEMLTERNARKLFPGFRLTGRQVPLEGGHVIDNEITAMLGLQLQHGVEAKGWNKDRWRMALSAWDAKQSAQPLNKQQAALANQLQHLLEQLADAAKAPRGKPFLVITDKLSGPTKEKLAVFLRRNARGTQVIEVEEAQILQETKQLRADLKLPEDLSGGAP
jgi:transposase-like protein